MDVTLEKLDDRVPKVQDGSGDASANLSGKRTETMNCPAAVQERTAAREFFLALCDGPRSLLPGPFFVPKERENTMLESLEATLYPIVVNINNYLSSYILVFLLIAVGLWYSIRTRFVQVRCFGEGMRKVFAILTGGPGAIFWMWIIAFFGMATIYAEATLAIKTRKVDQEGNIHGGPVYYITTAFQGAFGKFLAGFFAVAITLALGFMGCMVQSNSIGSTFQTAFGVPSWVVGIVLVVICAIIFLGGVQRLASVTEKIVPVMAAIFLLGGLVVLIARIQYLPATIAMIFQYAFQPQAIIGGGFGAALKTAISQGAKRGLFSNEAGMGSTPHAHAQANVTDPHDQGVVAMVGVFIDTFVVLTLNALVIISTLYTADGPLAGGYVGGVTEVLDKTNLAQTAFGTVMGAGLGAKFVAICLFFFAFSTVLGWNLFGKINVIYLFGKKSPKLCTTIYTVVALIFIFLGTTMSNDLVWELTDMFNNLMVIPNAIALFALTSVVVRVARREDPDSTPLRR